MSSVQTAADGANRLENEWAVQFATLCSAPGRTTVRVQDLATDSESFRRYPREASIWQVPAEPYASGSSTVQQTRPRRTDELCRSHPNPWLKRRCSLLSSRRAGHT